MFSTVFIRPFTEILKPFSMAESNPAEDEAQCADDMPEMMEVDGAIGGEDSFEEKKKTLEELERAEVKVVEDRAVMKCLGCGFAWIEHLNHSRWIKEKFLHCIMYLFRNVICRRMLCKKEWCRYNMYL